MYRGTGAVAVGAAGSSLAATGFDAISWAIVGLSLLVVGAVMVRVAAFKK
jgi:hypothetical protein